MKCRFLFAAIVFGCISSCNTAVDKTMNNKFQTRDAAANSVNTAVAMADESPANNLKGLKIANENDPVCDMPLLRGFEDTTMYEGKLIGFCSKECKDAFVKKPAGYTLKLKKSN